MGRRNKAKPPPDLTGEDLERWYCDRKKKKKKKVIVKNTQQDLRLQFEARTQKKQRKLANFGKLQSKKKEKSLSNLPVLVLNDAQVDSISNILDFFRPINVDALKEKESCNMPQDYLKDFNDKNDLIKHTKYDPVFEQEDAPVYSFANRLQAMKDSKFKHEYMANVHGNQNPGGILSMISSNKVEGLLRDEKLDIKFKEENDFRINNNRYKSLISARKKLPAYKMQKEIMEKIHRNQVVVLSGETGCGKTTQIAQLILDDMIQNGKGSLCHVVCTQPRRISAISVAQRVADERGEKLGISVGYSIRLESIPSRPNGSIKFCTTGIVLKLMQSDPSLSKVSHLILDEIHERDTLTDFLICLGKDLILVRPDIKLILMSATLNANKFTEYYNNCSSIYVPGFTFPVKEYYLEDVLEMTSFVTLSEKYSHNTISELLVPESEDLNCDLVFSLIFHVCVQPQPGALLVFLPGEEDIFKVNKLIAEDKVLGGSVRKIVLSTNIAETSITIEDIVFVINSGKVKIKNYDTKTHLSTLLPEWVSHANSKQRRGRAGRVQSGICYHLYTSARENHLNLFPLPEIQRSRLEEVILQIKVLQLGSVKQFLERVMDPPNPEVIDISVEMLKAINAIDMDENLTPLGFHLARLPMDPLAAKMVLMGALFSCLGPILTVAAALSFKDPFISCRVDKKQAMKRMKLQMAENSMSDHYVLIKAYDTWEESGKGCENWSFISRNFLSHNVLKQLRNMRNQFMEILFNLNFVSTHSTSAEEVNKNSHNWKLVRAVLAAGLYPNVARVITSRNGFRHLVAADAKTKLFLHNQSVNSDIFKKIRDPLHEEVFWLVYKEKMRTSRVFIYDSTVVTSMPLLIFGQQFVYDVVSGTVCVDKQGSIKIRCTPCVAKLIEDLRNEFNKFLEYRLSHPGLSKWDQSTKEGALLSTIVDLIASEDVPRKNLQVDTVPKVVAQDHASQITQSIEHETSVTPPFFYSLPTKKNSVSHTQKKLKCALEDEQMSQVDLVAGSEVMTSQSWWGLSGNLQCGEELIENPKEETTAFCGSQVNQEDLQYFG